MQPLSSHSPAKARWDSPPEEQCGSAPWDSLKVGSFETPEIKTNKNKTKKQQPSDMGGRVNAGFCWKPDTQGGWMTALLWAFPEGGGMIFSSRARDWAPPYTSRPSVLKAFSEQNSATWWRSEPLHQALSPCALRHICTETSQPENQHSRLLPQKTRTCLHQVYWS